MTHDFANGPIINLEFSAMRNKREESVISTSVSPVIENLESRVMLSSVLKNGVLKITGTAGADEITVQLSTSGTQILVQEGSSVVGFGKKKVKSINITTGDGNDHVLTEDGPSGAIKVPITIKVGAGIDLVHGGSGSEFIFGGDGDDSLFGGEGSDYMQGDGGNDRVDGEGGNDYVYGDAGNDTLMGGAGNDIMAGDLENTIVKKGAPPMVVGNDELDGGDGNDWMLSERRLLGSNGSQLVFASNGVDRFIGGAGNDIIDIGANDSDGFNNDTIVNEEAGDFVPLREVPHGSHAPGSVHQHMILKIKVPKGRKYTGMLVPANAGIFSFTGNMAYLHTHDTSGRIHFEPVDPTTYQLGEFFVAAGISMNARHVGRLLPPAGKKVTLFVTRNGQTKRNKLLDRFRPNPGPGTADGDVMELRVG